MSLRIGSISIDTNDLAGALAFWQAATGYQVESQQEDGYAFLTDPDKAGPAICLNVVPEPRVGKNRVHLDLFADDLHAEAARIEALGATRIARHGEDDRGWIVLADPQGNELCICAA